MTTITDAFGPARSGRTGFGWPRLFLRRLLDLAVALDRRSRERAQLAALDEHMLRDIGVSRADVEAALGRPEDHLRLILLRGGHELQH